VSCTTVPRKFTSASLDSERFVAELEADFLVVLASLTFDLHSLRAVQTSRAHCFGGTLCAGVDTARGDVC
jgi:hypothetical protein